MTPPMVDAPRSRGPRSLIINADDLGLTDAVNRGIWEAFACGSVTSASLMANTPGSADAIRRVQGSRRSPDIGVHVNLTTGRPLTAAVSTLVDSRSGRFHTLPTLIARAVTGRLDRDEVAAECTAQLDRVRNAGIVVSHLDSHQHVHLLPGIWDVVVQVARRAGIRDVRIPVEPLTLLRDPPRSVMTKLALRLSASWVASTPSHPPRRHFRGTSLLSTPRYVDDLLRLVDALPSGCTELMVHPGYVDRESTSLDRYTVERERELRALTSSVVMARFQRGDLQLQTFAGS